LIALEFPVEGFWSYAKERLIKHHGVSKERFPLYLVDRFIKYFTNNGDCGIDPLKPRRALCQEKAKGQNLS